MLFEEEFTELLKAKARCIWINSYETYRVISTLKNILMKKFSSMNIKSWSFYEGYSEIICKQDKEASDPRPMPPDAFIGQIIECQKKGEIRTLSSMNKREIINKDENLFVMKDFHLLINQPVVISGIIDTYERSKTQMISYNPLVIISPIVTIPTELEKMFTIIDFNTPSKEEITNIFNHCKNIMSKSSKLHLPDNPDEVIDECINNSIGLTSYEINLYIGRSFARFSTLDASIFRQARMDLIKKTGILEYVDCSKSSIDDMGGNDNFKKWINEIKPSFSKEAEEFGVEKSKGYLSLGVPGTAKTVSAMAIAALLKLPLLKFNMSSIMHSHVGQSERNMQNALTVIKSCSPCVLLIDEAEKALSGM